MKILITGSHSTGKTTLINEFVKANKSIKVHVIEEIARKMIQEGFPLGKNGTMDSYIHYINKQLEAEIESEKNDYDILLADRSIIDGVVHPIVNNNFSFSNISKDFIQMFEKIIHFQKFFYDIYIYIPIEFELKNDNIRPVDEKYRIAIDCELKKMLDLHIKDYNTISGTLTERVYELNEIIKKKQKL